MNDLIDRLAADLTPVQPRSPWRDAAILVAVAAAQLALFLWLGAGRDDMHHATAHPGFWWKLSSLALLAVVGAATALRSFDPVANPTRGLRRAAVLLGAVLVAGWAVDLVANDAGALWARLNWRLGIECVFETVVLTLPALVTLGLLMRRGASTNASGTAIAIGLTGAAWGAFVFAFACPSDDPLYVAIWYGVSITSVTVAARLILPRLTRW